MESPVVYLPTDRRHALAAGTPLPDRVTGAVLFADLSGFTALTEALVQELGPKRGAEELSRQLNAIYSSLIAEVDQRRGSVISFAGDAITCFFAGDAGRQAIACGLALQAALRPFARLQTPAGAVIMLALKVAVTAGPVRRFQVGDPAIQYLDVLAGRTLDRLAALEHVAEKGEVVVGAEVVDQLDAAAGLSRPVPGGAPAVVVTSPPAEGPAAAWPPLPPAALADHAVRPWLLPGVFERTRQGHFLAEIRPAVMLFLQFGGIHYDDDEAAWSKLDQFVRWAQSVLDRYGGVLLQLTTGDKGSSFYGAFGAPIAHDDDAARAAAAALELRALPEGLSFLPSVKIGLSQGRIWAGPYGGPTRRTYGVLGDEVNVAARLMAAAQPGQALVSERLARSLSAVFELQSVGALELKGKREPVATAELLGRRGAGQERLARFSAPLEGRAAELAPLSQALDQTLAGRGQVIRLSGTAGVGKSHLAAELLKRARGLGAQAASGVCQSTTERTAYAPWREVFTELLRLNDSAAGEPGAAGVIAHLQAFVTGANPDWLVRFPLLGDLLQLAIPDNATTAAFEPQLRQSALFDLAVEILRHQARSRPLVLWLDDAQWMDEASQGLTLAAARALADAPVLVLLSHRTAQGGAEVLPALDTLPHLQALELAELDREAIAALLARKLGGPPGLLALSLIMAETQGNPYFVEELVDSLLEAGHLFRRPAGDWALAEPVFLALQQANALVRSAEGHWQLAPNVSLSAVDLGLPDSIQGVVLSRIDRLPSPHQVTLKVASVVGRSFALDLLARSHPAAPEPPALAGEVELLTARDFTIAEAALRERFAFKHTVTRDVAYETLLEDQRRQLHSAVGRALEQLAPEAVSQLAYHLHAGGEWARALHYHLAAGQQAQRLFANYEGIEHFRQALACASHLPPDNTELQRQLVYSSLGELLAITGQYAEALEQLHQALQLAGLLASPNAQARACRWIAYVHEFRGDFPEALRWIEQGRQAVGQRETAFAAELLAIAGLIYTRLGNYDQALEQCETCVRIAERLGEPTSLAFAYNSRAIVYYRRGNSLNALEDGQRALRLYQQTENIHGQAMSCNGAGNYCQSLGRWSEADGYYRRARQIFVQTGDELHRIFADNNLGEIARYQGRLDEALRFYGEALQSLERRGASPYVRGVLHMNLGAACARQGRIGPAREHLAESQRLYESAGARDYLPELHRHLAEAALRAAETAEAERQAQQALDLARELTILGEEGNSLRVLAECALDSGAWEKAERDLQESIRLLDNAGQEYDAACSRLTLARLCMAAGRPAEAQAALDLCRPVFARLDAHLDLAAAAAVAAQLNG